MAVATLGFSSQGLSPAVNALPDSSGQWLVEKGFQGYVRSSQLQHLSGALRLSQQDF